MRPTEHTQCRALHTPGITRSRPVPIFLWSLVEKLPRRAKTLFCRSAEPIQEAKKHIYVARESCFWMQNRLEEWQTAATCCRFICSHQISSKPNSQQPAETANHSSGKRGETTGSIYAKSRQSLLRPRALVPLLWLLAVSTLAFLPCNCHSVSDLTVWPWESQLSFLMLFSKQ